MIVRHRHPEHILGTEHHKEHAPVMRINYKGEVALLRPRGQADGRAGPLRIDDNQRRLCDAGEAETLYHEAEAAARCGRHGPDAGVCGSYCHIYR